MGRGSAAEDLADVQRMPLEGLHDDLGHEPVPRVRVQWDDEKRMPKMNVAKTGGQNRLGGIFTVENGRWQGQEAYLYAQVDPSDPLYSNACRTLLGKEPEDAQWVDLLNALDHISHRVNLKEMEGNGVSWLEIESFLP